MRNSHELLLGKFNFRSFRFTQTPTLQTDQFELLLLTLFVLCTVV
jgi:hypothetical protein